MPGDNPDLPPELQHLLTLQDTDDDGPAAPLQQAQQQALIGAALDAWQPTVSASTPARRRVPTWLLAAAVLGAGSAAAYFVATNASWTGTGTETGTGTGTETETETETGTGTGTETETGTGTGTETETETETGMRTAQARDLIAEANRLRGEGRYRAAADTYLRAAAHAPAEQVGQVARVAAADLELERLGRPQQALSLYRQALSAPGPLSLEAHAGAARAQRALGDTQGERQTLERLLQAHGETDWARERLRALQQQGR